MRIKSGLAPVVSLAFFLLPFAVKGQVVLNEMSQGPSGTKEYIELVVIGNKTCTDSTADLRGWLIDDNNGWLGAGTGQGIAQGCMRFGSDISWSKVPYGSVILIYNDGDKNSSISLPDDETDNNHDYVYVLPASSSAFENNGSTPSAPSASNYVYPSTGFGSGGNWSRLGLANNGDAVILTAPSNPGAAYFSFGYGTLNNSTNATVYIASAGTAKCYYQSGNQYSNAASWTAGSSPANETPGYPNTIANSNWINGLRQFSNSTAARDTVRLAGCSTVVFNGITYTASAVLTDTLKSVGGCDSAYKVTAINIAPLSNITITASGPLQFCTGGSVVLSAPSSAGYSYLWSPGGQTTASITASAPGTYSVTVTATAGCSATASQAVQTLTATSVNDTLKSCSSIVYRGITYTSSALVKDTVHSSGGCDSIYRNTQLLIEPVTASTQNTSLDGCSSVIYNGVTYTSPATLKDTLTSVGGCDSVYRVITITITPVVATTQNNTLSGCDSVIYNGITYTAPATVSDTLKSTGNCDSIWKNTSIFIATSSTREITDSFFQGQQYTLPSGQVVNTPGVYQSILQNAGGCDSVIQTTLKQINLDCMINPPIAFTPNGDGYHDLWKIYTQRCFQRCQVNVYNRYGSLVYHSGDYQNDWNGQYKNGPLPDATYYFVIRITHFNGRIQPLYGNVTIMR